MRRALTALLAALGLLLFAAPAAGAAPITSGVVLHWPYKVVYVEDHTGWRWPVREAAATWDYGTDVSVRYGACRSGAGCVRAYEGYYGLTGWGAQTSFGYISSTRTLVGWVRIRFNDSYAQDAHKRRQLACHEEAHGLGLEYHWLTFQSCLYGYASDYASMYPNSYDRYRLNQVY
jgi:hypothetical protein